MRFVVECWCHLELWLDMMLGLDRIQRMAYTGIGTKNQTKAEYSQTSVNWIVPGPRKHLEYTGNQFSEIHTESLMRF